MPCQLPSPAAAAAGLHLLESSSGIRLKEGPGPCQARGESPVEPAERPPRGKGSAGSWQWARTAGTQRALLDAARAVFTGQGFADASIADVVERAGSSVGSLYHHFGGKSELFIALWQDYQQAQESDASEAVARARKAGVTDPFELFSAGARAFMEGCWQRRDLAVLFSAGDGPPGFEV